MKDYRNGLGLFIVIIAIISSVYFGIWFIRFKYHDCLLVGHSKKYCILDQLIK